MWRMQDGDRILTDAEWALLSPGLAELLGPIDDDLETGENVTSSGVGVFEHLTPEQKVALLADRTSCATMRVNQFRLYLSTVAYIVMRALREHGLKDTEMAQARCDTIRLKLFKIGALIRISVRRVTVALSEGYPFRALFEKVCANLTRLFKPTTTPILTG